MKKKIIFVVFFLFNFLCCAESNLLLFKEQLKAQLVDSSLEIDQIGADSILITDRLETDAFLEIVGREYKIHSISYGDAEKVSMVKPKEAILIMPRIDLLAANLKRLAENVEIAYVFIMDGDRLNDEIYGDRSYETYQKSGLEQFLPNNVKVLRLYNQSVGRFKGKNSFELNIPIVEAPVYIEQIYPIYQQISGRKYLSN